MNAPSLIRPALLRSSRCPATALPFPPVTSQKRSFPSLMLRRCRAFPSYPATFDADCALFRSAALPLPTLAVRYFPHVGPRLRPT